MTSIVEKINFGTKWTIRRYADDDAFGRDEPTDVVGGDGSVLPAVSVIDGNLLLNEGIAVLLDLACGLATPDAFSNANSYLAVGDSDTAASSSQTGLQAATNKLYKAVESGYPSRSSQTVTWRSIFGSSDANFDWNEFSVANGNSDSSDNLNRKVSAQGTKASGQTWTLDLAITIS